MHILNMDSMKPSFWFLAWNSGDTGAYYTRIDN